MLKFIGNGWIHGVPARDLSDDEARVYGRKYLLDSGLYVEVKEKIEETKSEVKDGN